MHDGNGGKRENKSWFERQTENIDRLSEIQRRFTHPDGRPTDELHAELDAIAEDAQSQSMPTPDEIADLRRSGSASKSDNENKRAKIAALTARLSSFMEEMQRPTPLDLTGAICDGDLTEVRRLLDAGVDPNALSSTSDSMLESALIFGHKEIAELLRERGAEYGLSAATLAGDGERLIQLLDVGTNVTLPDRAGSHLLHLAVSKGHTDIVRLLLARGANPNLTNEHRHVPLGTACTLGRPEIADLLVEAGAQVGIVEAAYLGNLPLLTQFLEANIDIESCNDAQITPLIAAAFCGHTEVVHFLLSRGAYPDRENENGLTPLSAAVAYERIPVVHLLIDQGANPNTVSKRFSGTALGSAVMFGKVHAVRALIARGANPNIGEQGGSMPLHQCATQILASRIKSGVMVEIATLLLDAGADIEARDSIEKTPLMYAAQSGDAAMVLLLLERGANVRASGTQGHFTPLSCVRSKDSLNDQRDKSRARTLIMEALGTEHAIYDAAERGDIERVTALLDAGAPADPLLVFDERMLSGPYFTAEDIGETPLMAAAGKGHTDVVKLLLARGSVSDKSRKKALSPAEYNQHEETTQLLQS